MAGISNPFARTSLRPLPRFLPHRIRNPKPAACFASASASATTSPIKSFEWDDVLRVADDPRRGNDPADLSGYLQKVRSCNRGSKLKSEFVPFVVENHIVGYIHNRFTNHLRKFEDVFSIVPGTNGGLVGGQVTLHPSLETPEERTEALQNVVKHLGELIPGIRNELSPVRSSFDTPILFSMERAAGPYFGIKAYGIHMNGYVEKDGQTFLWIGKRSSTKSTYPGMLDHLVAGGLPPGISCKENVVKECEEEAGIRRPISVNAIPVGAVSYMDIEGVRYKRDVLFCYDLKLPPDFSPRNEDYAAPSSVQNSRTDYKELLRLKAFHTATHATSRTCTMGTYLLLDASSDLPNCVSNCELIQDKYYSPIQGRKTLHGRGWLR